MKYTKPSILMIMYGKSVGGAELQFIELANFLAESYQVRLVSLGGDGALCASQLDEKIEVQVFHYSGFVSALKGLLKAFVINVRYSSRYMVTTSFFGNFLGFWLSRFHHHRIVSLQTVSKCMRYPGIDKFVLQRFDALVAGASDIKDYLVAHGQVPAKVHVIHNWVDFSKRIPSETTGEVKNTWGVADQLIIGCIGRLHPQKGQIYLIRAFAKVIEEFPASLLMLVGEGESRRELEEETARLGLMKNIIFTGTATGENYNNLLSIFDIYVQPSVFEGLPRTLLDAMYVGKAIIATDINGNREAIQNGTNGLLVSAQNSECLSDAILELLHNPEKMKTYAECATNSALQSFGMEKQLARIEQVIVGKKS